jgi:Ca-activated chloride channel family protein
MIAPWLVITTISVLVVTGLGVGYTYVVKGTCTGKATANIIVAPGINDIMERLATNWASSEPSVGGKCGSVDIEERDSALVAQALGEKWNEQTEGVAPDVWVPEASAWVQQASADADAERIMPDRQPSVARTPIVIAMPKPMADALGWPKTDINWSDLLTNFGGQGWAKYREPTWGPLKLGMTDPSKSTAGLLALMSIIDENDSGDVEPEEQKNVLGLKRAATLYKDSTEDIFGELSKANSEVEALKTVSAFPALEQDILAYNRTNPTVPLVAVYPTAPSADADHPYLILNASWVSPEHRAVAQAFLAYVRGQKGRGTFLAAGFRDSNREPGADLTENHGFATEVPTLPRAVLLPDSVRRTLQTWTAVTRPMNILLVIDTTGTMRNRVDGLGGKTVLELTQAAAADAMALFDPSVSVGLWNMTTAAAQGPGDYHKLVPIGPLADQVGSIDRRQAIINKINGLAPNGATGLYNTVWAAHEEMASKFQADSTNLVVILTDGLDNTVAGGLSRQDLINKLAAASKDLAKRVPVVMVGIGKTADPTQLQEISAATGAPAYSSQTRIDIDQVLMAAIFTRIS